jgi:hypothetical protein
MDGETIRLVATATGAVIAGLGGAGIAGWFNRSNTMATIAAAELQASLDREQEHAQWLRDRKVKSYAAFLSQVRDLELALSNLYGAEPMDPRRLKETRTLSVTSC